MKIPKKHFTIQEIERMKHWGVHAERVMEFLPPLFATAMIIHDIALCMGYRWAWTETIVIAGAVILMLLFSYALGFCRLHRCFILYNWMMLFCIHFERTVGFQSWLQPMHYIMLAIGIILLIQLYVNKHNKMKKRK